MFCHIMHLKEAVAGRTSREKSAPLRRLKLWDLRGVRIDGRTTEDVVSCWQHQLGIILSNLFACYCSVRLMEFEISQATGFPVFPLCTVFLH
jgi:hypothetical protein